ncbi:carbohydrate sulfotransferase 15 [Pygocentrus nattereri]|uniref:Sulfotransferase n=1 Tax=Pygocentrus nattereri TaxID=42514 RepID=A0A3B4BLA7_PYGNA|nr:carbohydrate sulfotransferase 15 [Pygocentrus nattereri]
MDYKYGLLTGAVDEVENYKRKSVLGDGWLSLLTTVEDSKGLCQPWGPQNLGFLRKAKVLSFLFCLVATFFIMASYVLTRGQKGLQLTPSPYHFRVMSQSSNLSSGRDYAGVKEVVRNIVAKVEFHQRKVPELMELREREAHIFSAIPRKFLPYLKNPCWYEEYTGNSTVDPYGQNLYALYSKRFQVVYNHLRSAFQEHLHHEAGRLYRLRCLPYFYIIGQPKCGTTDLYDRLRLHPQVQFTTMKEPHWWTRKRFGIIRLSEGFHSPYPLKDYLDLFDQAAYQIQDLLGSSSRRNSKTDIIIGEASASTMWDNNAWVYFYDNGTGMEPPCLVQDFIHAVQPDAKFIVMLRDPVERLYSDYLYFGMANKTVEDFHERVSESLQLFEVCLAERSMRSCVYNTTLNNAMPVRLQVGLYVVYLLDWLSVFSRDQILVLRLEDHAASRKHTMHKVFDFLELGPLTQQKEADITKSPASNTRRPANRNLGPMLPVTREILQSFYGPFNQRLAQVLRDPAFLWTQS